MAFRDRKYLRLAVWTSISFYSSKFTGNYWLTPLLLCYGMVGKERDWSIFSTLPCRVNDILFSCITAERKRSFFHYKSDQFLSFSAHSSSWTLQIVKNKVKRHQVLLEINRWRGWGKISGCSFMCIALCLNKLESKLSSEENAGLHSLHCIRSSGNIYGVWK